MNSSIKRPEDLFAKIDSVFSRAGKVFDEIPNEAIGLARNVGSQKSVQQPNNANNLNNGQSKSGLKIK